MNLSGLESSLSSVVVLFVFLGLVRLCVLFFSFLPVVKKVEAGVPS